MAARYGRSVMPGVSMAMNLWQAAAFLGAPGRNMSSHERTMSSWLSLLSMLNDSCRLNSGKKSSPSTCPMLEG